MQFTMQQVLGLSGGAGGQGVAAGENDILAAFRMPSIIPVHDEFGGYAGTASKGFNNPRNPVASREGLGNNRQHQVGGFGNVYVEFDPIPGLTLRSSLGGNYTSSNSRSYGRWQYENSENNSAFSFSQNQGYSFGWTFTQPGGSVIPCTGRNLRQTIRHARDAKASRLGCHLGAPTALETAPPSAQAAADAPGTRG